MMWRKLVAVVICVLGLMVFAKLTFAFATVGGDFDQDYAAALSLRSGGSIYAFHGGASEHIPGGVRIENFHPPSAALFFLPFSYLPFWEAFVVFNVVSLLLYGAIVCLSLVMLKPSADARFLAFAFSLFWYPFHYCIATGQSSLLISASVFFAWLLLRQSKERSAGAMLGIAALMKLFPLFLLLYFVLVRKTKALYGFMAVFLAGMLLSLVCVGRTDFLHYFSSMLPRDLAEWGAFPVNISITGYLLPVLTENKRVSSLGLTWESARLVALGVCVTVVLLVSWLLSATGEKEWRLRYGFWLCCAVMILVSPISWTHILPLLAYPLLRALFEGEPPRRLAAVLAAILLSLPDVSIANQLVHAFEPAKIPAWAYLLTRSQFYGLCLLAWLQIGGLAGRGALFPDPLNGARR